MFNSVLLLALAFPLEWNATYRTDVPYEVELNVRKLGASAFTVLADGRELPLSSRPGKYQVFALGRYASHQNFLLHMADPASPSDKNARKRIWREINEYFDYRGVVYFGREGGRGRWKWDTVKAEPEHCAGWLIHPFEFPEGTDELAFSWAWDPSACGGYEFAAALVLPEPDDEGQLMLRHLLFGLNVDPMHVE